MRIAKLPPVAACLLAASLCAAQVQHGLRRLDVVGTGSLMSPDLAHAMAAPGSQAYGLETKRMALESRPEAATEKPLPARAALLLPSPVLKPIVRWNTAYGFDGLNHADSRLASGGNQFSVEPSDQALAVNGEQVLQATNDVLAVYSPQGKLLAGPTAANAFFGLSPEIVRGEPTVYGPYLSDPQVLFDADTQRWFLIVTEIDVDPASGKFRHHAGVLIAVSQSADATGKFDLYSLDVTDAGFARCPCLADQPLLGINADGLFVSTNQFSLSDASFQTALILALDKRQLAAGNPGAASSFQNLTQAEGPAYSVRPAIATAAQGTEYLLSSLDFAGTSDNRLTVWALNNTQSLGGSAPDVSLSKVIVRTQTYGQPPEVTQKSGPTPLRDAINALGGNEQLAKLDAGDDRVQQVWWRDGVLLAALNTVVLDEDHEARAGIAWFAIRPAQKSGTLSAKVVGQGYVAVNGANVMNPAIAVAPDGTGAMVFNLVGTDYFPSMGYVWLSEAGAGSLVHLLATGVAPADGFSGYELFGGDGAARWGDYTAAAVAPDGGLWLAGGYVPDRPRTELANWGSFVARLAK